MHDGQNLFSPSSAAFGVEWRVDESLDSLSRIGLIDDIIVIGIDNTPDRSEEYNPLESKGRLYMDYICDVLRPYVDSLYNTAEGKQDCFTAGSSMGGLISLALAWERDEHFGGALCMSPAVMYKGFDYVSELNALSPYPLPKLYIDNGGIDLEKILQPGVDSLNQFLLSLGYDESTLKLVIDPEAKHFESAWAERFPAAIHWLIAD
jgi:enterochelin esterase-like enzyme